MLSHTTTVAQHKSRNTCADKTIVDKEKSISFYKKKLAANSKDQNALYRLGMSYYKLIKLDSAIYFFDRLIEINSKYHGAYSTRGICKLFRKDKEGACEDFRMSIQNGEDGEIMDGKKISGWVQTECLL